MSVDNALVMASHGNYRMAAVEATPERLFSHIYNGLSHPAIHLSRLESGYWQVETPNRTVRVVRPHDALRVTHIGERPERRVYDRYTMGGFRPADGDVVVDCGAFIGEFSWQVCERHDVDRVVAVEPDPRTHECLRFNSPDCVETRAVALSDYDGRDTFNVASDPTESSLLRPDKGSSSLVNVNVRRLDSVIDDVDFLKVEAEGNEPEVLEGVGDLRPSKIVVNVSPERDGKSPAPECTDILEARGYATKCNGDELFAWLR